MDNSSKVLIQIQQPVNLPSQNLFSPFNHTDPSDQNSQYDATYKPIPLRQLCPTNVQQQKKLFFEAKCQYTPIFSYSQLVKEEGGPVDMELEGLARKVAEEGRRCKDNERKIKQEIGGQKYIIGNAEGETLPWDHSSTYRSPKGFTANNQTNLSSQLQKPLSSYPNDYILTREEVTVAFIDYLSLLGLQNHVQLSFVSNTLSRTSVVFYKERIKIRIRVPLEYTGSTLEGVLNHEIGTHIVRALNHKENCLRKPTERGKLIEQGLAAINQLLPEDHPYLFKAAVRYLSSIYASRMGFQQLFASLNKYIHDSNQCWQQCVRVKRGMVNTGHVGGFYKDQGYFIGAVMLLKQRKDIDWKKIYYARLAPQECHHLEVGVLPPFLATEDKLKHYKNKLEAMSMLNFIQEYKEQQVSQNRPNKSYSELNY